MYVPNLKKNASSFTENEYMKQRKTHRGCIIKTNMLRRKL